MVQVTGSVGDVLRVASGEVGYSVRRDPRQGSKYGRWYAERVGDASFSRSGVPYCAMFVSWVFEQAGAGELCPPFAYCPAGLNGFRKNGRGVPTGQARPGDIVFFDWDGGVVDHVGIVKQNLGNGSVVTIEGNTSSGARGSQVNGGLVAERVRRAGLVSACVRPDYGMVNSVGFQDRVKGAVRMFTFRVNSTGGIWFYGADGVHPLHHKDELEALKQAFKKAGYGELPHVELGAETEPWGTRLLDALTRENTHTLTLA